VVRDEKVIGTVVRVEHMPAQDLLIVRPASGSGNEADVMVPFVEAIVPSVDVAGGRVIVTPPGGLFEELPVDEADENVEAVEAATNTDAEDEPDAS